MKIYSRFHFPPILFLALLFLSNGNSEIDLSLEGEAIMAELKRHKKLKKSLLIDPEDPEYNDLIIEGKFTFRDWLEQLRGNLY
jgi:hypothetical protein